jgi:acetoin utilization deacetylase AcuC-like enzyme
MAPRPVFLEHPSSLAHDTGPHPERSDRILAIAQELDRRGWLGYERMASPEAELTDLLAVHPERHLDLIEALAARGGGQIDADTVVSAGSWEAAQHAAGGAVRLVDALLDGEAPTGISVHRPPGHHAEAARAMGFCLVNNIAVAARHAVVQRGLSRVLILDWDVHHGNGTNDIFNADPSVLFVSVHQSPLYPGTGPASDVGSGAGRGMSVNLPVAPGSGDAVFCGLVEHVAVPLARAWKPQLLLVSAGFDAHREDPLADCTVTDAGYAAMAAAMRDVGGELRAPVGAVLEGGYALGALGRGVAETMAALAGAPGAGDRVPAPDFAGARAARERLAEWFPALSG